MHRFTYHVLQQKRHSLKNGFFIEQNMGTHLFGSPCIFRKVEKYRYVLRKGIKFFFDADPKKHKLQNTSTEKSTTLICFSNMCGIMMYSWHSRSHCQINPQLVFFKTRKQLLSIKKCTLAITCFNRGHKIFFKVMMQKPEIRYSLLWLDRRHPKE